MTVQPIVINLTRTSGVDRRAGQSWKENATVATQANINIAAPGAIVDGVTMKLGYRVLVRVQTAPLQNGLYDWNGPGLPLTRSDDATAFDDLECAVVVVAKGTSAGRIYRQSSVGGVIGVDAVNWTEAVGSPGGASSSSPYLTVSADASLPAARVLTAGNGIAFVDAGVGSTFTVSGWSAFRAGATITATPGAIENDYGPTGWNDGEPNRAGVILLNPSAPSILSGLTGGLDGRIAIFRNVTAEMPIMLLSEWAASAAANRFALTEGLSRGHIVIWPGDLLALIYNATTSRWSVLTEIGGLRSRWERNAMLPSSGATLANLGLAHTAIGTITHPGISGSSYRLSKKRARGATGAGAGTSAGTRVSYTTCIRGAVAGVGGFACRYQFGFGAVQAGDRFFVGLQASTGAPANGDPSALIDVVGFAADAADTRQVRTMVNDGTGAATKTDLGANYPLDTSVYYDAWLFAASNGSGFTSIVSRLDDLTVAPDVRRHTADIPGGGQTFANYCYINNGANAADAQIEWSQIEQFSPQ